MTIEGQLSPAEVLEIVTRCDLAEQVADRCGHARVFLLLLQSEKHQGCRSWDGIGSAAQYGAVAIVDAAIVKRSVHEQAQAIADARMFAETGTLQGQAGPGGRLHPAKIPFRPRPTGQRQVDIVHLGGFVVIRLFRLDRQQTAGRTLNIVLRSAAKPMNARTLLTFSSERSKRTISRCQRVRTGSTLTPGPRRRTSDAR